ncbi:hypothetical protein Tco_0718540 [Tanacetum coccineum]
MLTSSWKQTDGCMEGWGGIVKWKKSKEDPEVQKKEFKQTTEEDDSSESKTKKPEESSSNWKPWHKDWDAITSNHSEDDAIKDDGKYRYNKFTVSGMVKPLYSRQKAMGLGFMLK